MAYIKYKNGYYKGEVDFFNKRSGYGELYLDSGNSYKGEWQDDLPHGQGTYYEKDGYYSGRWVCGKRSGYGKFVSPKLTFEGYWVDNIRCGQGVLTLSSGTTLEGEWTDNSTAINIVRTKNGITTHGKIVNSNFVKITLNGYYKQTYRNGYYEGYFVNDQRHGKGKYTWKNGEMYDGEWKNGKMSGQGTAYYTWGWYTGQWDNGQWCGRGTKKISGDDSFYEGNWNGKSNATDVTLSRNEKKTHGTIKDNIFKPDPLNGFCKESYSNGYYEGHFVNGKRHGKGKYAWNDGSFYDGEWSNGTKSGFGKITYADNSSYEGQWRDDKYNGKGTLVYKNGDRLEGIWIDDKIQNPAMIKYSDGFTYEGNLQNGQRHGKGKYSHFYYSYDGEWQNDKKSGFGEEKEFFSTHNGYFLNDKYHGQGTHQYDDGSYYEGDFFDGVRQGFGKHTCSWGHYEGNWKNDSWCGSGIRFLSDGSSITATWTSTGNAASATLSKNGEFYFGRVVNNEFIENSTS